jgi:3-oxoacyl-[acyl-carrier protein] reductase
MPQKLNRYAYLELYFPQPRASRLIPLFQSQVAAEAIKLGAPRAQIIQFDISKVSSIRSAFADVAKIFPQIDISIVNSGVTSAGQLESTSEEEYDRVFDVNTKGAFFTAQESAKLLRDGGRLIFISSVITHSVVPGYSVYAASKGALNQFARFLSVELAARKITVNTVSPGPTDTDMLAPAFAEMAKSLSPFKRLGTAEDIGKAVEFLASDAGAWVTGADLNVSGGASVY